MMEGWLSALIAAIFVQDNNNHEQYGRWKMFGRLLPRQTQIDVGENVCCNSHVLGIVGQLMT